MASSSVDLPLPFSPTKNVTLLRNARSIPREKARILNGYFSASIRLSAILVLLLLGGCRPSPVEQAEPCCNSCEVGWSLSAVPGRQAPILRLALEPGAFQPDTGVSECEEQGLANATPRWEVVVTGKLERDFAGADGDMEVDELCVVGTGRGPG